MMTFKNNASQANNVTALQDQQPHNKKKCNARKLIPRENKNLFSN